MPKPDKPRVVLVDLAFRKKWTPLAVQDALGAAGASGLCLVVATADSLADLPEVSAQEHQLLASVDLDAVAIIHLNVSIETGAIGWVTIMVNHPRPEGGGVVGRGPPGSR